MNNNTAQIRILEDFYEKMTFHAANMIDFNDKALLNQEVGEHGNHDFMFWGGVLENLITAVFNDNPCAHAFAYFTEVNKALIGKAVQTKFNQELQSSALGLQPVKEPSITMNRIELMSKLGSTVRSAINAYPTLSKIHAKIERGTRFSSIFNTAFERGDITLLNKLKDYNAQAFATGLTADFENIVYDAAVSGDLAVLQFIYEYSQKIFRVAINDDDCQMVQAMLRFGNLSCLEFVEKKYPESFKTAVENWSAGYSTGSKKSDHVGVLQLIAKKLPAHYQEILENDDAVIITTASNVGAVKVLDHVLAYNRDLYLTGIKRNDHNSVINAAYYGHDNVLDHIFANAPDDYKKGFLASEAKALNFAAQQGHTNIFKNLQKHDPKLYVECLHKKDKRAIRKAVEKCRTDILLHIIDHAPQYTSFIYDRIIRRLDEPNAQKCLLKIEEHLRDRGKEIPTFTFNKVSRPWFLCSWIAENDRVDLLQQMHTYAPKTYINGLHDMIEIACKYGNITILQEMSKLDKDRFHERLSRESFRGHDLAAIQNHVHILEFFKNIDPKIYDDLGILNNLGEMVENNCVEAILFIYNNTQPDQRENMLSNLCDHVSSIYAQEEMKDTYLVLQTQFLGTQGR